MPVKQEMKTTRVEGTLRSGECNLHDLAFVAEMDDWNRKTKQGFVATFYKDCLKYGYYEYQSARDWYRNITLPQNGGEGMHVDLVFKFVRTSAVLAQPFIPHHAEFIWREILDEPTSVQSALWTDVGDTDKVDRAVLPRLAYMPGVLSYLRSTQAAVGKKRKKERPTTHDPSKPRSVRIYVAAKYPEWKYSAMSVLKEAYDEETQTTDDKELKKTLIARGLLADKRVMPMKVRTHSLHNVLICHWPAQPIAEDQIRRIKSANDASALSLTLPYSKSEALGLISGYIKTSMKLKEVAILSAKKALACPPAEGDPDD